MDSRWWWYWTVESGWNGKCGPWGPFQALDRASAERRASALSTSTGRTLDRVEPLGGTEAP